MALQFKPNISFNLRPSLGLGLDPSKSHLRSSRIMMKDTKTGDFATSTENRKLPVLLFDVMDTIVRDPFYQDVPAFFGMPMKELMECKHPTAWNEFEKGLINEDELARKFFKDGRQFDLEALPDMELRLLDPQACQQQERIAVVIGLKMCMKKGYSYLDGVEGLLSTLKHNNFEMHAFTNYPIWYQMIEEKLKLSNYLSWTFCSCTIGKQKPDPGFYSEVLRFLHVEPGSCIFVDDRMKNVEGAKNAGMVGLQFKDADVLRQELSSLGINASSEELSQTG